MNERQEEYVFREGFRRGYEKGKADRHMILGDGTLVISVSDATAVTRVLVRDEKKNGDLYYNDRPKGEWIDTGNDKEHLHPLSARWYRCSVCGLETNAKTNYCFDCGADMKGADDE